MKPFFISIVALLSLFSCQKETQKNFSTQKIDIASNWEFTQDSSAGIWQKISLPHTAQVEPLVVNDQFQGDVWYRKTLELSDVENMQNALYFEGIMHEATFWLNGQKIATHQGGYTPIFLDLSKHTQQQKNELIVKVNNEDNQQIPPGKKLKALDFNFYGGIYRKAFLIQKNKLHITNPQDKSFENGGILIHFDSVTKESASGNARVHVQNLSSETRNFSIHISFELNNQKFAFVSKKIALASQNQQIENIPLQIQNPELWHPNHPNLYNVTISVMENNQTIDEEKFTQGIRHFNLKKDGFYVNHEKYFLQGTNRHQEYPYIGYALSDEAQMRDAILIKNAGFNFVRLSHYPHSEAFMQACDELGLITMNCISGWQYYGDATFVKNSIEEIKSLARRDRNRASVAFWEVSLNESDMPESYMKQANETLKKELPFKNIYTAGWIDHPSYDLYIPARQHGKAPLYWNDYQKDNRKIIIAEYGDWEYYAQNAGFNQTEFANLKEEERTSRQLRAFGEKRLLQQAFNFQEAANSNMKGVHTIGHANWLMFDYNRGYSDDIESSGISDIFRIPKFAYYFYQSQRNPNIKLDNPLTSGTMVHIASYWTEKSPLDVKIYSNTSEVKLTLNGKEIGIQKAVRDAYSDALLHPPFIFKIPKFEAGILKAEAIVEGKVVATHEVHTPGKAVKIELSAATQNIPISSKNKDFWFVYAQLTDINNQLCVEQTDLVKLNIQQGNAQIIGPTSINAEAGIATFLIESQPDNQTLILEVSSEGLKKSTLEIKR